MPELIKLFENESVQVVKHFRGLHKSQNFTMTVKYNFDLDGIDREIIRALFIRRPLF
jgi:hypothetical protein